VSVVLASHDAGGSELVSSYVRQHGLECAYALAGPAQKIFERKLGAIATLPLEEAINQGDWLLCGTSWQSDLEWHAIGLARACGKHSIAFLDHWTGYRERFLRGGVAHLPDEIWVGDQIALDMAHSIFPGIPVLLVPNPYFIDLEADLAAMHCRPPKNNIGLDVLYVCEPIGEGALRAFGNERHWGYTEHEALRYFFSNLQALDAPVNRIVIRPHPAEAQNKYLWARREFDLPIAFGQKKSLLEEIVDCDVVVGCASMAMVVGLLAGKRVVSSIPPGGRACSLPQPEIELLASLIQRSQ
jgi:hypothetical protein